MGLTCDARLDITDSTLPVSNLLRNFLFKFLLDGLELLLEAFLGVGGLLLVELEGLDACANRVQLGLHLGAFLEKLNSSEHFFKGLLKAIHFLSDLLLGSHLVLLGALNALESLLHALIHRRLAAFQTSSLILVSFELCLNLIACGLLLSCDSVLSVGDLISEHLERVLDLILVRLQHLYSELVNDLPLKLGHQVVLHLKKNVRDSINDLVLDFKDLSVIVPRKHINETLILIDFVDQAFHELVLLLVVSLKAPLQRLLDHLNNGTLGALRCQQVGRWRLHVVNRKLLSAARNQLVGATLAHLLAQLGKLLLDEVLHDLDARDDDFFEYALALVHLDEIVGGSGALRVVQIIVEYLVGATVLVVNRSGGANCGSHLVLRHLGMTSCNQILRAAGSGSLSSSDDLLTSGLIVCCGRSTTIVPHTLHRSILSSV